MISILVILAALLILWLAGALAVDITITATNVVSSTGAQKTIGTAGTAMTITAGQACYLDPVTGNWFLSKANGTAAQQVVNGIALTGCSPLQAFVLQTGGTITIGATVVVGKIYVSSGANAGGIAPEADLVTGWVTNIIGVADTTGSIKIVLNNSAVTHA